MKSSLKAFFFIFYFFPNPSSNYTNIGLSACTGTPEFPLSGLVLKIFIQGGSKNEIFIQEGYKSISAWMKTDFTKSGIKVTSAEKGGDQNPAHTPTVIQTDAFKVNGRERALGM